MSKKATLKEVLQEEEDFSEIVQNPVLDDDKVALHDVVAISRWIRSNGIRIGSALFTIAIIIASYVAYSLSFKENTKSAFIDLKNELHTLQSDIHAFKQQSNDISVLKADMRNIEFRINELQNKNNIGLRLYKLESGKK